MVHGFKIENDKLILDVEEILQYPLLQQIYARDDSKDKSCLLYTSPSPRDA